MRFRDVVIALAFALCCGFLLWRDLNSDRPNSTQGTIDQINAEYREGLISKEQRDGSIRVVRSLTR